MCNQTLQLLHMLLSCLRQLLERDKWTSPGLLHLWLRMMEIILSAATSFSVLPLPPPSPSPLSSQNHSLWPGSLQTPSIPVQWWPTMVWDLGLLHTKTSPHYKTVSLAGISHVSFYVHYRTRIRQYFTTSFTVSYFEIRLSGVAVCSELIVSSLSELGWSAMVFLITCHTCRQFQLMKS